MSTPAASRTRLIVTIVIVVAALLTIFLEPLLVKQMLSDIIPKQQAKTQTLAESDDPEQQLKAKLIEDTPYLVSFFYPFWMGLGVFGGITLLVIARDFYLGKTWARGVALLALAMPSIGGAYMFVPWINFVGFEGGFPPAMIVALLGLIPYFTILLAEKGDAAKKVVLFFVFLMLGVQATHSFANGHASLRIQWMHPARPAWPPGTWVLWLATQAMWWGTICLILSILFLGMRKRAGWYLATIGGATTMLANYWTHLVRGTTSDYILGGTMGLVIVVLMLIPAVRERLFMEPEAA
jgi:hypothetical protein